MSESTNAVRSDDTLPSGYRYSWSPGTTFSIEEFVAKYKPSMVQNDGTKPWIWVRREQNPESPSVENEAAAVSEAATLLQQVAERVEQIKNDSSIPVRANKKAGTRSKKEVREQVQAEATDKLKDISKKYGFVCGKWLTFAPSDKVDVIWSKIASSLANGPLSSTVAFCAKVSTSPENDIPGYQHVICIYMPDVYEKEKVTEVCFKLTLILRCEAFIYVMKVLLRQHGLNLSGVKSDLYTMIGLDSKHPSGIPSTVWKNASLLKESEIKELKDAYFAELSASKAAATMTTAVDSSKDSTKRKPKPLMKKKVSEDPFASDDESDVKGGKSAGVYAKRKAHEGESNEGSNKSPSKRSRVL